MAYSLRLSTTWWLESLSVLATELVDYREIVIVYFQSPNQPSFLCDIRIVHSNMRVFLAYDLMAGIQFIPLYFLNNPSLISQVHANVQFLKSRFINITSRFSAERRQRSISDFISGHTVIPQHRFEIWETVWTSKLYRHLLDLLCGTRRLPSRTRVASEVLVIRFQDHSRQGPIFGTLFTRLRRIGRNRTSRTSSNNFQGIKIVLSQFFFISSRSSTI